MRQRNIASKKKLIRREELIDAAKKINNLSITSIK